jgi:ribonuclease VapC
VIALDTSAVVAVALREPDAEPYSQRIVSEGAVIGTPTLFECHMVLMSRMPAFAAAFMKGFVERRSVRVCDFTTDMYEIAAAAFEKYGKGRRHPAQLNFGDCMAYAVAKHHGLPLLYKGEDFSHTDIKRAAR